MFYTCLYVHDGEGGDSAFPQCPLDHTPWDPTPPRHRTTNAGGTHPAEMLSCLILKSKCTSNLIIYWSYCLHYVFEIVLIVYREEL